MTLRDAILAALGTGPMDFLSLVLRLQHMKAEGDSFSFRSELMRLVKAELVERLEVGDNAACYRLSERSMGASDHEIAQDGTLKGAVVNNARKRGKA